MQIYDSLYASFESYSDLKEQLKLCYMSFDEGKIKVVRPQLQDGLNDCALFAIATAYNLASGVDPTGMCLDQNRLRQHLLECFECHFMSSFPTKHHKVCSSDTWFDIVLVLICLLVRLNVVNALTKI